MCTASFSRRGYGLWPIPSRGINMYVYIYVLYTAVADSVSLLFTDPRSVHPLLAPSSLTCTGTDLNPHSAGSLSLSSLRTHRVACACLRLKPVWRDAHPAQAFLFPRSSSVERVVLSARALVHRAGRESTASVSAASSARCLCGSWLCGVCRKSWLPRKPDFCLRGEEDAGCSSYRF